MSDDFVRDLEDELVAAARFRATRRARRRRPGIAMPSTALRPPRRSGVVLGAVFAGAIAALAIVAILTLSRPGGDDRVATEPPATFPLPAMAPLPGCGTAPRDQPAADRLPPMAIFDRPQYEPDGMPSAVEPDALPLTGYDAGETRRPGIDAEVTLVPSRGVRDGCTDDDGPGVCVVAGMADPPVARCFTAADISAGRAVALLGTGVLVGVVPDGIDEVTLTAGGERATVPVVDNAFEATLPGIRPGTPVRMMPRPPITCALGVAPELRDRVTALLDAPQPGLAPGRAVTEAITAQGGVDAIALDGARFWGGGDGVDFWVIPVVSGGDPCAPASEVCIVAESDQGADAICGAGPEPGAARWRIAPLPGGRSAAFGLVPDRATAVTVEAGGRSADVDAGLNVFGGVLPFPVRDGDGPLVEVTYERVAGEPRVGVVDGGGDVVDVADRLTRGGFAATNSVTPGRKPQPRTTLYWQPGRVSREDAARVASVVGAGEVVRITDADETPRPVIEAGAPVVVVVGADS